jgi:hypothetical protein
MIPIDFKRTMCDVVPPETKAEQKIIIPIALILSLLNIDATHLVIGVIKLRC